MKRSYIGIALGALVAVGGALSLPSCGHPQKLVSLQVTPSSAIYPTPQAGQVVFSAIGTYIHPPATKDITAEVTWTTDVPELLTLNYQGVPGAVAPNGQGGCGIADVIATAPEGTGGAENIVPGYANVTVNNPAVLTCPGGGTETTLSVQVSGPGTVTSVTGNINCPTACIAEFPVGATVGLTAEPQSGATVTWASGCTASSGNSCSVTIPTGGANVLATFN
ncbi:MAG: hypothetical protein WCB11_24505 [Terriglobales bacterium]